MYTNEPDKFLSATNGLGTLFGGGVIGYLLVGTAAYLVGGKYASGKWAWQKSKRRKKK